MLPWLLNSSIFAFNVERKDIRTSLSLNEPQSCNVTKLFFSLAHNICRFVALVEHFAIFKLFLAIPFKCCFRGVIYYSCIAVACM